MNKEKVLPMGVQGKTGLSPDASMPIIRGKIYSSLEHAISLLETEKNNILVGIGSTGDDHMFQQNRLAGITKAISILNAEKSKEIELVEKKF